MVKLGEVAEIVGGSTPKTNESSFWDGEFCWVTPAELGNNKYISSTNRTITDAGVKNAHLQLLPIGTVLLSSRAPIGKLAITKVAMYCNQGFKNLVCSDKLYNEFAYWFLYYSKDYLNSLGTGATFKEISKRVVEKVEIPLPPLPEQERIVSILDAEFAKIDAVKAGAEKSLQHAKDLFQAALKKELTPKEGWETKKLEEVIKLQSGENLPAKKMQDGIYPVYGGNGVSGYHNDYNMMGENIIIGRVGALCGNVRYLREPFWLTDNGFKVILNKGLTVDLRYLTLFLNFVNLRQYAKQTAQPVISNVALKEVPVILPPLPEQQSIVSRLDTLNTHCKTLQANYERTIALCDDMKQALLRKAFNGEL